MDSRYTVGIDMGRGDDMTMYCITRRPSRFMMWVNRLLKRADRWKIIYCGPDPNQTRKYRYHKARVLEGK